MTETILIHKLSAEGEEVISYAGVMLKRLPGALTLRAVLEHDGGRFGPLELQRGDVMIETYYQDRWYNIFEVHDGSSGRLKGWYCNIARPPLIEAGQINQEDLALDFVVDPEGVGYVFDREEFEELDLTDSERRQAEGALRELESLLADQNGPFAVLAQGQT